MPKGFPLPLSADQLFARSREMTGIDIVDTEVVAPFTALLHSLNHESELHERGALELQDKMLRQLCNRLRMLRDYAAHPEIDEQEVVAPVVLCGLPRTGSTKMQRVLAATGDFNWLPLWQSVNFALRTGARDESTEMRIREAGDFFDRFHDASPKTAAVHAFEIHEPDEESHILEQSFYTSAPYGYSDMPSYLAWLAGQDPTRQFRYLKKALKYLQWQGPHTAAKRWALKSPIYTDLQVVLRQVFPDATLVMSHRDLKEVLPSTCSLLDAFHEPFTTKPIEYHQALDGFQWQLGEYLKNRQDHPELDLLEFSYAQVAKDSAEVVERIYRHIGLPFTDRTRDGIRAWEKNNSQHKKGVHSYSLEEFGFTPERVDAAFATYNQFLGRLFA